MPSFYPKDSLVDDRQLKVQRLSIPFSVTASATPASVVLSSDEPAILFLRSQGVDQITVASGALESGETATYSVSPNDASGIMNLLVKVNGEEVQKVCSMSICERSTGQVEVCKLGDSDGLSSEGKIMLTLDSAVNHATTNADYSLEVAYIVED